MSEQIVSNTSRYEAPQFEFSIALAPSPAKAGLKQNESPVGDPDNSPRTNVGPNPGSSSVPNDQGVTGGSNGKLASGSEAKNRGEREGNDDGHACSNSESQVASKKVDETAHPTPTQSPTPDEAPSPQEGNETSGVQDPLHNGSQNTSERERSIAPEQASQAADGTRAQTSVSSEARHDEQVRNTATVRALENPFCSQVVNLVKAQDGRIYESKIGDYAKLDLLLKHAAVLGKAGVGTDFSRVLRCSWLAMLALRAWLLDCFEISQGKAVRRSVESAPKTRNSPLDLVRMLRGNVSERSAEMFVADGRWLACRILSSPELSAKAFKERFEVDPTFGKKVGAITIEDVAKVLDQRESEYRTELAKKAKNNPRIAKRLTRQTPLISTSNLRDRKPLRKKDPNDKRAQATTITREIAARDARQKVAELDKVIGYIVGRVRDCDRSEAEREVMEIVFTYAQEMHRKFCV